MTCMHGLGMAIMVCNGTIYPPYMIMKLCNGTINSQNVTKVAPWTLHI